MGVRPSSLARRATSVEAAPRCHSGVTTTGPWHSSRRQLSIESLEEIERWRAEVYDTVTELTDGLEGFVPPPAERSPIPIPIWGGNPEWLYSEYVQGDGLAARRPARSDRRGGQASLDEPQRVPRSSRLARSSNGAIGRPCRWRSSAHASGSAVPARSSRPTWFVSTVTAAGDLVIIDTSVLLKWFHSEGESEVDDARTILDAHADEMLVALVLELSVYESGQHPDLVVALGARRRRRSTRRPRRHLRPPIAPRRNVEPRCSPSDIAAWADLLRRVVCGRRGGARGHARERRPKARSRLGWRSRPPVSSAHADLVSAGLGDDRHVDRLLTGGSARARRIAGRGARPTARRGRIVGRPTHACGTSQRRA